MTGFDLEGRTKKLAFAIRNFVRLLPKNYLNADDIRQVIRSSGSVAANYLEANNSLSRPDFLHRIKICRKEAKETVLWIELLSLSTKDLFENERKALLQEAKELVLIFAAILRNAGAIR